MVAKEANAGRVINRNTLPDIVFIKDRRHWRDVLVTEPQVDAGKSRIPRTHRGHAGGATGVFARPPANHVCSKYLFSKGHWTRRCADTGHRNSPLQPSHIKRKQPAVLDYLAGNLIFPGSELTERNVLPRANPVNQRKIGRG